MLGRTYERENCSAARALELVGERWSLLIIRNGAFAGMTRFSEFERRLGVAPNILAKRLADFVTNGLMEVVDSEAGPRGRSYRLTAKGRELNEVIMVLTAWGDRWAAPNGPPVVYEHAGCGGTVAMTTTCTGCEAHPSGTDVVARTGPGATAYQRAAMENRPSQ
ncbi:winged helix-turn-helix transcriptional regulator [Arthrobacter castelli]|uniref:winged helix-turn-helix transcriptional regulator n=1 Tax=Arthrobacter castelli TaxID=271431 RepID=UPI00068862E5|nr:helix-turn-helix domain-containing protein [Arthrobacter castelli]